MDYWLCVAMSTNGNLLLIFHFQAGIWRSSSNDLGKTRPSLVRGTHNLSPERAETAPFKTSPVNSWRCQDCWGLTHIKTDAAHGESWERCLFKYSNFICFVSKLWILKAGSESNHILIYLVLIPCLTHGRCSINIYRIYEFLHQFCYPAHSIPFRWVLFFTKFHVRTVLGFPKYRLFEVAAPRPWMVPEKQT